MASSRLIAAGETYTPDDINYLRADVLDPTGGHKHNGTDGARVPFANLDVTGAAGSTAPSGGAKSYNDLATHVASSQGQHGLSSLAYVLGGPQQSMFLQAGTDNLGYNIGSGLVRKTVVFPVAYSSVVAVLCSTGVNAVDVAATQFVAESDDDNRGVGFSWIAVGVKTP